MPTAITLFMGMILTVVVRRPVSVFTGTRVVGL
jgi:hypothetical protein